MESDCRPSLVSSRRTFRSALVGVVFAVAVVCGVPSAAMAQPAVTPGAASVAFGKWETVRWEQGIQVEATGLTTGIVATLPFPQDWPEQRVRMVSTEYDAKRVSVRFISLGEGARQMVVTIPRLRPDERCFVRVVFDVERRDVAATKPVDALRVPKRLSSKLRAYLQPSPFIESRDRSIRRAAKEATEGASTDWERVEKIYDWVREHVRYQFDDQIRPAVEALQKGHGDCEELTSLFVAMCRAQGIPARSVWVPGHCYPEFYLERPSGEGTWFPCQAAGTRLFGEMVEQRPILQKGDRFKVRGKSGWQRYVAETLVAKRAESPPKVAFFRRPVERRPGEAPKSRSAERTSDRSLPPD